MPPIGTRLSPGGARVTPTIFFVSETGCQHMAASRDGARAHAIERLLAAEAAGERAEVHCETVIPNVEIRTELVRE